MTTTRLYRLPAVISMTGYSRATIYRKMSDGSFPPCVKLGARAVAWHSTDIEEWIASRPSAVEVAK